MVGVLNCGYYGGSIAAAAIDFGTNYITNDWSWRIPFIGQAVPAMVVMFAVSLCKMISLIGEAVLHARVT